MKRILIASFVLGCLFAGAVEAFADGPMYVEQYTTSSPAPTVISTPPNNGSAQGVAELMARSRQCRHFGNPAGGYEGVGMGSSPEAALRNCCYSRSRLQVVDQGVAFGGGRWWACKRYR